jgi:CheY-like chemotaxis protein
MGHKILLADDSITIQKVIELTFSDEDFELHTVGNGQKAIDEIRSIMPHIVLCDIIMPEKNGYEVCEFIKSNPDLKHIPVLLLTGAFEPFDQERARNAGCDGFLAKPFEPQTLISKVKELLSRAPVPAAAASPAPKPFPTPAAPSPLMDPVNMNDERTVIMPPSGRPPAPTRAPHVAPAPPPPPQAAGADYAGGFDDAFAIEAGERELMMEPGDHTVLLGGREGRSEAPASGGDDIWGAVEAPVASEEEDSSTVFMPPPPIGAPQAPTQAIASQDYEVQYAADGMDATWRMPSEGATESAPSYQGFEEFADPPLPEASTQVPPPIPGSPTIAQAPPLEMPPPLTPEPIFEPYDPFVAAAQQHSGAGFEPISPFVSDQTLDSGVSGTSDTFERIPTGTFDSYGEPEIVAQSEASLGQPELEPVFETNRAHEPFDQPFDELDAPGPSEIAEPPAFAARTSSSAGDGVPGDMPGAMDDALIDKLAARVIDKLSKKIIQEIAWEVVPDLAEGMIKREIDALKAKLAKVPK